MKGFILKFAPAFTALKSFAATVTPVVVFTFLAREQFVTGGSVCAVEGVQAGIPEKISLTK